MIKKDGLQTAAEERQRQSKEFRTGRIRLGPLHNNEYMLLYIILSCHSLWISILASLSSTIFYVFRDITVTIRVDMLVFLPWSCLWDIIAKWIFLHRL